MNNGCPRAPARPRFASLRLSAVVGVVCALVGCSEKPVPTTYPVTGKVTYKGGRTFAGGTITFTSKTSPPHTMDSAIRDDGSFALGIVLDNRRIPGGVPGPCRITIGSRLEPGKGVEVYLLSEERVIEPHDNVFAIEVDPALARR